MGTRFQQSIPPHLLLQNNPNRFSQSISRLSFLQSRFPQSTTGNSIQNTIQRHPSHLTRLSNNQFPSASKNQLLHDKLNTESLNINIDPFSSDDPTFNKRLVYYICIYLVNTITLIVLILYIPMLSYANNFNIKL